MFPTSQRCIASCSVWTMTLSTGRWAKPYVGCAVLSAAADGGLVWWWTRRAWRKELSGRFFVRRMHHHDQRSLPWRH